MHEVVGDQQADRKFDLQRIQTSSGSSCGVNKTQQIKTDNMDVNDTNSNMQDYLRSSINRAADKWASQVLTQKIHN